MISTAWSIIFTGSAITSEVPTFRNLPSAIFCSKRLLVLDTHVDGLEHQVGGIHVFLRQLVLDTQTT